MRVAIFSDSLPPRVDGIAIVVRHLISGLVEKGHEVLLIGPDAQASQGVRPVRLPAVRTPFDGYPLTIPLRHRVRKALRMFQPEIISIQTAGPVASLGLSLAARHRIRVIFSWHTDFTSYELNYPVARTLALAMYLTLLFGAHGRQNSRRTNGNALAEHTPMSKKCHRTPLRPPAGAGIVARTLLLATARTAAVWAPSTSAVRQIRSFGVRRPVFVMPADVRPQDLGVGSPAARQVLRLIPGAGAIPYLLYVGRLSREKNLDLLLEAFTSFAARNPEPSLVLAGPSHDPRTQAMLRPYLRALGERIVLLGSLARQELGEIYRAADLFVTPSLSETQCLCVSEALALEVPVLVVDPMLAQDRPGAGVQVADPEPESLARAIAGYFPAQRRRRLPIGARRTWPQDDLAARFLAAAEFPTLAIDTTYHWCEGRWAA